MTTSAMAKIRDEILGIMEAYHEQEAEGRVDTPGGLEHMGDVWSMLHRWEEMLLDEGVGRE